MKTALTAIKYMQSESRICRLASLVVHQEIFTTKEISESLNIRVSSVSAAMQQLNKSWGFHFESVKTEGSRRHFRLVSCSFEPPLPPSDMTPLERLTHQAGNYPKSSIKYRLLEQAIKHYPLPIDVRAFWEEHGKKSITNVLALMKRAGFSVERDGHDLIISDFQRNTDKEEEVIDLLNERQLPLAHRLMNQCTREDS